MSTYTYINILPLFLPTSKDGRCSKLSSGEGKQLFRPEGSEEKRELCDSKLTFLLAAIGYVAGLGNVWCFNTGQTWGWLVSEG